MVTNNAGFLPRGRLNALFDRLRVAGYRIVAPTVRDEAIVYDFVDGPEDLPAGVSDRQGPGEYRLEAGTHNRLFAWATGPQAIKPHLFAAREPLWAAERGTDGGITFKAVTPEVEPIAILGARACDLAALALQDQHFLDGPYRDPHYAARRARLFLAAVNCSHPSGTCFCASTGDGPHASEGYDLVLTELDDGFLVHAGSWTGRGIGDHLGLEPVEPDHREAEAAQAEQARARQHRALPGRDLRDSLFANLEHPRWDDVAERCLACGNCTSVCPTCFCHAQVEVPDLGAQSTTHLREWDSCFTQRHCQMHGYRVRPHIRQRYRQWLTHKLGAWHDQYGRSGCVGCGRCIAWCPVGIDITQEAAALCAGGDAS